MAGSADLFAVPRPVGVRSCSTFHEQIDRISGGLLLAASLTEAEGLQTTFVIRVPAGVDRGAGLRLMVLPRDLWKRVQRRERITVEQARRLRPLTLSYKTCDLGGCIAETLATPQLLAELKTGGALVVVSERGRRAYAQAASLSGFQEAYHGPPVDTVKYHAARAELMRQLRLRQGGLRGAPPMQPGGAPAMPPGGGGRAPDGYGLMPPTGPGGGGYGTPTFPPPVPSVPPRRPSGVQDI